MQGRVCHLRGCFNCLCDYITRLQNDNTTISVISISILNLLNSKIYFNLETLFWVKNTIFKRTKLE